MKTWIRPMIIEECYVSNESIADSVTACYKIACAVGKTGNKYGPMNYHWETPESNGVFHASSGTGNCSDADANRIITGKGGVLNGAEVGEHRSDQGWLPGVIDKYYDAHANGIVDTGDIIYWHTTNKAGTRWNHWGRIQGTSPNHPNHS